MTITYSLWQGANLLSVDNKANNADELLKVMADLNKLGKNFTYNVRKVEVQQWSFTQTQITSLFILTTYTQAVQQQKSLHGYQWEQLHQYGQLDNGKNNWQSILLNN